MVLHKHVLCVPFCTGGRGAGGSRSKNLLEEAMKQMQAQGHTLRLLDEARQSIALQEKVSPGST